MKTKRYISLLIDSTIAIVILLPLVFIADNSDGVLRIIISLCVIAPLYFVLVTFAAVPFVNGSIGMKMMGLIIVDKDGKKPTRKQVARSCWLYHRWLRKNFFNHIMREPYEEWEVYYLGTQIILKKDYKGD